MEHIKKRWGEETVIIDEPEYVMKFLKMNRGFFTSKHFHPSKKETLYVHEGNVKLTVWKKDSSETVFNLRRGEQLTLNPETVHRITAVEDTLIIEVSTQPAHDSVRLSET